MRRWLSSLAGGAVAGLGLWWWWRLHPTSRPFAQRVWVAAPHPFITRDKLRQVLAPVVGEKLLEVGVGSGYYAAPLAGRLGDRGVLTVLDLHDDMLALTMRRAGERGLPNVVAACADATALPLRDDAFDGAYLVSVLGQVPDPAEALGELRRVVRPGGRVVVGEFGYDPHGVSFPELRRRAARAGLVFEERAGSWVGYLARFAVPASSAATSMSVAPQARKPPNPATATGSSCRCGSDQCGLVANVPR